MGHAESAIAQGQAAERHVILYARRRLSSLLARRR